MLNTLRKTSLIAVCALLLAAILLVSGKPAKAQGLIRDTEIEHIIKIYSTPIFQSAGLSPNAIRVFLINNRQLNAFVTPGQRMFLHTGLLQSADKAEQVIGVIAHESGHLAGGHTVRIIDESREAGLKALAADALGIIAALASGQPGAAAAVSSAGRDVALRDLLSYSRTQESAADQAAVSYLKSVEMSPRGILEFMQIISNQEALLGASQDPYLRTHPLTRDRLSFLEQQLAESPYRDRPADPRLQALHDRMRAKLIGFLEPAAEVKRTYPKDDNSLPAQYARAISAYRHGQIDEALAGIGSLIEENPNDPYFYELRGQILYENQRAAEALPDYEKAVELLPREPLLHLALARVQIGLNQPELDEAALENLSIVVTRESENSEAWRLSSIANSRLGRTGETAVSTAEWHLARRNWRESLAHAERAQRLLPEGSSGWLRALDIAGIAERNARRQENR